MADLSPSKTCTKCGEAKGLAEFHASKECRFGVRPSCKVCYNIESRGFLI